MGALHLALQRFPCYPMLLVLQLLMLRLSRCKAKECCLGQTVSLIGTWACWFFLFRPRQFIRQRRKCFIVVEPLCPLLDAQADTIALVCSSLDALGAGEEFLHGTGALWNLEAEQFTPNVDADVALVATLLSDAPNAIPRRRLGFIGSWDLARAASTSHCCYLASSHELEIARRGAACARSHVLPVRKPDCTAYHSRTLTSHCEAIVDVPPAQPLGGVAHDCTQQ